MKKFVSQNKVALVLASIFLFMGGEPILKMIRAERYGLIVVFLIAISVLASALIAAFKDSKHPSTHLTELWDMPLETTRTGLWIRSGFVVLMGLGLYFGFRYDSWLNDDSKIKWALLAVDAMNVLVWLPFLYWLLRRQYRQAPAHQFDGNKPKLRKSYCSNGLSQRELLKVLFLMVVSLGMLAVIGIWLR